MVLHLEIGRNNDILLQLQIVFALFKDHLTLLIMVNSGVLAKTPNALYLEWVAAKLYVPHLEFI